MIILLVLVVLLAIAFSACGRSGDESINIRPEIFYMKSITKLVVMEVYYHNVAKYKEDAQGVLLWKREKHFWIEYSGIITIGIDTSLLNIIIEENEVIISIPESKVNEESLTKGSFLVAETSAKVSGEDEIKVFGEA